MGLWEGFRLAGREFVAYRTRSLATVVTIGLFFGVVMGVLLMAQGLKTVVMDCAAHEDEYGLIEDGQLGHLEVAEKYFADKEKSFVLPVIAVLVMVAAFILALTLAQLLTGSVKTLALFRAIGASRWQVFGIYFAYLLELCLAALGFALLVAFIVAGIVTAVSWGYLSGYLKTIFISMEEIRPVLIGFSGYFFLVMVAMLAVAPLSFLLCLDRFSDKKIAQKLKGEK